MSETTKRINVAKDYSAEPAGRFRSDGPFSGERFRQDYLLAALKGGKRLIVDFDGTEGYGSSFLEESFGGLVRKEGYRADALKAVLTIVSEEDPSVIEEVWDYINEAKVDADR